MLWLALYVAQNKLGSTKPQHAQVQVETLEAKAGRKGHIKLRGSLPVGPEASPEASHHSPGGLHLDIQALELRSRNLYTGT